MLGGNFMSNMILPNWAPRVDAEKIKKLYKLDSQGIIDEFLLEDVGYALLSRAYTLRQTLRAHHEGIIYCPACQRIVPKTDILECTCGWNLPWKEYHNTYRRKQLTGASLPPMVDQFIQEFEKANDYHSRMRSIDNLIHRFHWGIQNMPTRPVAVNFINLGLYDTVKFIIELGYCKDDEFAREQWKQWLKNAKQSGFYNEELKYVKE